MIGSRLMKRIIVLDDKRYIRELLAAKARRNGHDVITAESAEDVLGICGLAKTPYDLLLTDFDMPGLNGLQLAECLHTKTWTEKCPKQIVLVTGRDNFTLEDAGSHFSAVIHKPCLEGLDVFLS